MGNGTLTSLEPVRAGRGTGGQQAALPNLLGTAKSTPRLGGQTTWQRYRIYGILFKVLRWHSPGPSFLQTSVLWEISESSLHQRHRLDQHIKQKKPAIKQRLRNLEKKREKGEEADRDKRNHLISCGSTRWFQRPRSFEESRAGIRGCP